MFRCSFYWAECDPPTPGGVPEELTESATPFRAAMRGGRNTPPRCIALHGEIGISAACSIYQRRSSVCRAFVPSYFDGTPNPDCDRARAHYGLPPLTPDDWRCGGGNDRPRPLHPTRPRAA